MSAPVSSPSGWLVPAMALPFPGDLRGVPWRTGPRSLAFAGSSPRALRRLFGVLGARHLPGTRARRDASPGVLGLFRDMGARSPLTGSFPTLPTFRPQRFSRSRRVAPPRAVRACFVPQPRLRFPLQGVSPVVSRAGSSPARSLSSLAHASCGRVAPTAPAAGALPTGISSNHRSVPAGRFVTSAGVRSPLEFSLPRVFLRAPWSRLRGSSAPALARRFLV